MRLNVFAPMGGHLGYAVYAKNLMGGLLEAGVDVHPIPVGLAPAEDPIDNVLFEKMMQKKNELSYSHLDPSLSIQGATRETSMNFCGGKRIMQTFVEWWGLSPEWIHNLNSMDAVFASSQYTRDIFLNDGVTAPIYVTPGGVDTKKYNRNVTPLNLKESLKLDVSFAFILWSKWEKRKGSLETLRAFCQEFKEDEDVGLVICGSNPFEEQAVIDYQITSAMGVGERRNVRVIKQPVPSNLMPSLYRACDAFVLPTRGEGFGLCSIEAMACGLPSLLLNAGAHLEFANEDTTFFINNTGLEPTNDYRWTKSHYGEKAKWLGIDEPDLRNKMRYAFEHRNEVTAKGNAAAKRVSEFTWLRAGQAAKKALGEICG